MPPTSSDRAYYIGMMYHHMRVYLVCKCKGHGHIRSKSQMNYDIAERIKVRDMKEKDDISFKFKRNAALHLLNLIHKYFR